MPTRNHDIKSCRFPARPAVAAARVAFATARDRAHRLDATPDSQIASRLRAVGQWRVGCSLRRSPQATDRCARARPIIDPLAPNNVAACTSPTLLVTGSLTASDAIIKRIGWRVSERVESVSRALRQPGPPVDALFAHVTSLHVDLANQLVSLAQARRVRAAAIVYERGSAPAIFAACLAGFHLFRSTGDQIDQVFVLAKLQRDVALASMPDEDDPPLRFRRQVDIGGPAAPSDSSCTVNAGHPVTLSGRHAYPRVRR